MSYDYCYKCLIIGDANVGKTNMCLRMAGFDYIPIYDHTIGVEFSTCYVMVDDTSIKFQLWDTAGQKIFGTIIKNYFMGVAVIFIVYDVSDKESFQNVEYWLNEIRKNKTNEEPVRLVLIGNKTDKRNKVITTEMGQKKADNNNMLFFEISARSNDNILNMKKSVGRSVYTDVSFTNEHPGIIEFNKNRILTLAEADRNKCVYSDCCKLS